jgi:2-amino-4-hydroxy-6-hydroxymethyldihydropteridine diphosphokinase
LKIAYLSLGSNLGEREQALRTAVDRLQSNDFKVRRISSVFETAPQDVPNQPWFLNLVVEGESELLPLQLLHYVLSVERGMGRKRTVAKGPRTLDIDILLHGNAVVNTEKLQIPHPRMTERRFVLEPLAELIPDFRHPVTRRSIREHLASTMDQPVRKLGLLH